jgi:hypothetical protein
MTMMDNAKGFGPMCGINGEDENEENYKIHIYDNWVSGEIVEISDCPDDDSYCYLTTKGGLGITGCALDSRPPMPTGASLHPLSNLMGGGVAKQ